VSVYGEYRKRRVREKRQPTHLQIARDQENLQGEADSEKCSTRFSARQ